MDRRHRSSRPPKIGIWITLMIRFVRSLRSAPSCECLKLPTRGFERRSHPCTELLRIRLARCAIFLEIGGHRINQPRGDRGVLQSPPGLLRADAPGAENSRDRLRRHPYPLCQAGWSGSRRAVEQIKRERTALFTQEGLATGAIAPIELNPINNGAPAWRRCTNSTTGGFPRVA